MNIIKEGNWGAYVLNFIIKGITNYNLKKKKSIDGYLFALMIVYFHLSKNKDKKGEERPPQPWIANSNREQLVERMRAEMDEHMVSEKKTLGNCKDGRNKREIETNEEKRKERKKQKESKASSSSFESETSEAKVYSSSKSETEEDSEEPKRKQPTQIAKKTQSKKSKLIVEDSSPEQTQSYHESEIGTEELEEFLRESKKKKNNEKSTTQGEKGADLRSTEGHYDSSETISDISLGSDDHLSQGHTDQSSINKLVESM
ncbi:hypothetical protein Ahy_B01g056458 [Arachis hypogaea]|uniref:Uncharacterized protein n=1 Tax=Arachis hypogaea TaxID=3818 RepID=A0A445AYZ9_ARAHY|nr:hypothetical protein Ahy_B01g056458 [Arachis hypogaea]